MKDYRGLAICCILCVVVGLVFLIVYVIEIQNNVEVVNSTNNSCFADVADSCGPDQVCCYGDSFLTGSRGNCRACCEDSDCTARIEQPPAGEFGSPFCIDFQCQTYLNGESSQIPSDGYPVYTPSETLDNSKSFHELNMPRNIFSGPILEQVWHIDFNEQEGSFDGVDFNGTHITIPSYEHMLSGYSKSYNNYDEHETGIVTLIMAENTYSVVADYPKVGFVEKYHTLTYDGVKDFSRGEYIKEKAEEQIAENPEFNRLAWASQAYIIALGIVRRSIPSRMVQGGLDIALAWQVRRYVNSYREDKYGSVNPTNSTTWATHSEKAKQAIALAKDPNFEREYVKSEQHCKHFEEVDGMSFTADTVTFPVGRPMTIFSGELVSSPVHYLGLGIGHATIHYDPSTRKLEILMQAFAYSRQHTDFQFPGPYPNGLWVAPVADGSDYVVDPDTDGRGDSFFLPKEPKDIQGHPGGPADFTLWARPAEETCGNIYLASSFWEDIDVQKSAMASNGVYESLSQSKDLLMGVVGGMPCARSWMSSDFGVPTHGFGTNEIGVWAHSLSELRGDKTRETYLRTFWDEWECFYVDNCE